MYKFAGEGLELRFYAMHSAGWKKLKRANWNLLTALEAEDQSVRDGGEVVVDVIRAAVFGKRRRRTLSSGTEEIDMEAGRQVAWYRIVVSSDHIPPYTPGEWKGKLHSWIDKAIKAATLSTASEILPFTTTTLVWNIIFRKYIVPSFTSFCSFPLEQLFLPR